MLRLFDFRMHSHYSQIPKIVFRMPSEHSQLRALSECSQNVFRRLSDCSVDKVSLNFKDKETAL